MMNKLLLRQNTILNELQFTVAAKIYTKVEDLFNVFMKSGLDENSLGFWIWDIPKNIEIYSPKFRSSLQYSGEHDFPSVPESWMNAIFEEDKSKAIENFEKHVISKGDYKYIQKVRYRKKYSGVLEVMCQGKVISWIGDQPNIMVGVHMPKSGLYQNTVDKFRSLHDEDVRFGDMLNFSIGKKTIIYKGIEFTMNSKNDNIWEGICDMEEGSELPIHHHSDMEELFAPEYGIVIDLIKNIEISKSNPYKFLRDQSHLIYCKKACRIKITGVYKGVI